MKKIIVIFMVALGISSFASSGSSYTNYRAEKSRELIETSQSVTDLYVECLAEINRRDEKGQDAGIDTVSFLEDLQAMRELEERILDDVDEAFFDGGNQKLEILRERALEYKGELAK